MSTTYEYTGGKSPSGGQCNEQPGIRQSCGSEQTNGVKESNRDLSDQLMMLQLVPCLQNRHIHLLHSNPQLHPKSSQDIPTATNHFWHSLALVRTHPERFLHLRRIVCGAGFLDFRWQWLPVCEICAEMVEDVFGFKVSKEPFGDGVSEVLDF